jgi:hypothetical protein
MLSKNEHYDAMMTYLIGAAVCESIATYDKEFVYPDLLDMARHHASNWLGLDRVLPSLSSIEGMQLEAGITTREERIAHRTAMAKARLSA